MSAERAAAVARLVDVLRTVNGRKRLQKIVHLLQARGYSEFSHRFELYHYGPFSRELADEIDFLCNAGVLRESKCSDTFQYAVSDTWKARLERFKTKYNSQRWAAFSRKLDEQDTSLLEAVSTIAFLSANARRGGPALRSLYLRIKPHLKSRYLKALSFASEHSICDV